MKFLRASISFLIRNVRGVKRSTAKWVETTFFPSNKESLTSKFFSNQNNLLWIKVQSISETTFLIQVYWEILNWANLCSWTCGQSEISDLKHGVCAVESGQRERFSILTKRCSWRFTNKKDDIRGDWGSDYWFDHLWNAWNIDVRTVKPRRIPPSPSMSIWWTREKQFSWKEKTK